MNISNIEPLLRDATVKAIDTVREKFAGAEVTKDNAVTRLLNRWNALKREEKENVASVIIASAIMAVSAIGAVARKKSVKKQAKKAGKRALKRVAKAVAD
ncbi:MAG TPA: hypothetical protein VLV78_22640 [Thermoanaerobaculia bacterium]|nr:hypothetical protein [Thermoanaerobaculia bacterium]